MSLSNKCRFVRFVVLAGALLHLSVPLALADTPEIIWQRVLDSRLSLQSGHIVLDHESTIFDGDASHELCSIIFRYKIWFNSASCRYDVEVYDKQTGKRLDPSLNRSFRRVMTGDRVLDCMECDRLDLGADESKNDMLQLFPPIALGCIEGGFDSVLESPNLELLQFSKQFKDFHEYVRVEGDKVVAEVESDRLFFMMDSNSGMPSRIEFSLRDDFYSTITETMWREVSSNGQQVWYPQSVDYQRLKNGKLQERWATKIQSASFNEPVDSTKFTWQGLGLPDGKIVVLRSSDGDSFKEMINGVLRDKTWETSSTVKAWYLERRPVRLLSLFVGMAMITGWLLLSRVRKLGISKD